MEAAALPLALSHIQLCYRFDQSWTKSVRETVYRKNDDIIIARLLVRSLYPPWAAPVLVSMLLSSRLSRSRLQGPQNMLLRTTPSSPVRSKREPQRPVQWVTEPVHSRYGHQAADCHPVVIMVHSSRGSCLCKARSG